MGRDSTSDPHQTVGGPGMGCLPIQPLALFWGHTHKNERYLWCSPQGDLLLPLLLPLPPPAPEGQDLDVSVPLCSP